MILSPNELFPASDMLPAAVAAVPPPSVIIPEKELFPVIRIVFPLPFTKRVVPLTVIASSMPEEGVANPSVNSMF